MKKKNLGNQARKALKTPETFAYYFYIEGPFESLPFLVALMLAS